MDKIEQQFLKIFAGCERGHGEYRINSSKGAKQVGKAETLKTAANTEHWIAHLIGRIGLGIVPITERNSCTWGAVDIDIYEGLDLEDLSLKLPHPLVLCRSKSGGAHVYLFSSSPVPAQLMRKKLALVARALGHANAEIFPKQSELDEGGVGNWINMPYFNGDDTNRYCLKLGVPLTMDDFIYHAEQSAITLQQLVSFEPASILEGDTESEFWDAPPCLRYLTEHGFPKGSMNNGLFSMGVYAKRKFSATWQEKIGEYNLRFMGPGSYSEVNAIIRSLSKKVYQYRCGDQPCLIYCNKDTCGDVPFGIQREPEGTKEKDKRPNILDEVSLVKCYTPSFRSGDAPYWVFTIGDRDLTVTYEMIASQVMFRKEYICRCKQSFLNVSDPRWNKRINELLESAVEVELAPDAGPEGQMLAHLEDFCTLKSAAKVRDEIMLGKPFHSDGITYFRQQDFLRYLEQQRYRGLREVEINRSLTNIGGKHHRFKLKGKDTSCWGIPSFAMQTDEFDSEDFPDEEKY